MKKFHLGSVVIDPIELGSRANGVLGIRDSGKTVTAKDLGEGLHDSGIPLTVFDPSGMWRFLRVPGKGKGRPVVVAGGKDADLPLTPASAPKIVEAAMQAGLSLVLQMDVGMSKGDQRTVVRDSVRMLMRRNAEFGLRHVIIEEAAEFVPQRVQDGLVYAEVERLVRMGGNAGLGCTMVNQRAEEINKAVLELCDNLFLHRQKGKNSLKSLEKWLDLGAVKDTRVVIESLSTLPSGECWAWLHGSEQPVRIKVPMCDSFHPNRRDLLASGAKVSGRKPVAMDAFVAKMLEQLPKIEEERKANDVGELRKHIAQLEKSLRDAAARELPVVKDEAALKAEYERGYSVAMSWAMDSFGKPLQQAQSALEHISEMALGNAAAIKVPEVPKFQRVDIPRTAAGARPTAPMAHSPSPRAPSPPRRAAQGNGSSEVGSGGLRRILVALAQRPEGLTNRQIGVRAALSSKSGTFSTYLSKARSAGWIEDRGDVRVITDAGIDALGSYDPLPTGADLREHWLRELGDSGAARILRVVADAYPGSLSNSEAGERANLSHASGTFSTYLSKLRSLELITGKRTLQASPELFD